MVVVALCNVTNKIIVPVYRCCPYPSLPIFSFSQNSFARPLLHLQLFQCLFNSATAIELDIASLFLFFFSIFVFRPQLLRRAPTSPITSTSAPLTYNLPIFTITLQSTPINIISRYIIQIIALPSLPSLAPYLLHPLLQILSSLASSQFIRHFF